MERKGGCLLVPRYGGASAGSGVDGQASGMSWQIGRIMLKFRPIAPKPVSRAPASKAVPVDAAAAAGAGRGKRKAVAGGGGRRGRKSQKTATVAPLAFASATAVHTVGEKEKSLSSRSSSSSALKSVDSSPPSPPASQQQQQAETLPLMPVSPAEEQAPVEVPTRAAGAHPVVLRPTAHVAFSWIAVEDVTSTWHDGEAPSAAAATSACGADGDAPAFVSDQWGRVTWANAAFSRTLSDSDDAEAAVALAGALPAWGTCAGFTCLVRVRHASPCRGGSVVAPCDVWRLNANGCYLWRLDLQAALTLGSL